VISHSVLFYLTFINVNSREFGKQKLLQTEHPCDLAVPGQGPPPVVLQRKGLTSSIHTAAHNHLEILSQGILQPWVPGTHMMYRSSCKQNTHTHKVKNTPKNINSWVLVTLIPPLRGRGQAELSSRTVSAAQEQRKINKNKLLA